MLFPLLLLSHLINLFVVAVPFTGETIAQIDANKTLNPRQLLLADPSISCCTSCGEQYSFDTFWHVFNDFCGWAGNGLELWTSQEYYTGTYYCQPGSFVCIHLLVQYLCGGGSAYALDYNGCMNYFLFTIYPPGVCNGAPYSGARIESSDSCWIFQATADDPDSAVSRLELDCDDSGRFCTLPNSEMLAPLELNTFSSSD